MLSQGFCYSSTCTSYKYLSDDWRSSWGYIYVDENTKNTSHLQRSRICIIASNLVLLAMIELDIGDWCYEISIPRIVNVKPMQVGDLISLCLKISRVGVKSNTLSQTITPGIPISGSCVPNYVDGYNLNIDTR